MYPMGTGLSFMSRLVVTFIDTAWGDCILIESHTDAGQTRYGLVDCNDISTSPAAMEFVIRRVQSNIGDRALPSPLFDFVVMTHGHADHAAGLQTMINRFATDWFWYPKMTSGPAIKVIHFANRFAEKVHRHQAVDRGKLLPDLGAVQLKVLWPPPGEPAAGEPYIGPYDPNNENNNSIVLALTLDKITFVLTSDCEAGNWPAIVKDYSLSGIRMFQAPCHGSQAGMFDRRGGTPWLDHLKKNVKIVISGHGQPNPQPDPVVLGELDHRKFKSFNTNEHYHVSFETDGHKVQTKWAH
jgi:beta-lactamase superfamily II metal-dependent hydrolase